MEKAAALLKKLRERYPAAEFLENEPMKVHTSFRIGGEVRAMLMPKSAEELRFLLELCRDADIPMLVVGNCSNMLFSDDYHDMVVIKTCGLDGLSVSGNTISAGAGVTLARTANFALENGLSGFEFAHGIPGTLGGAVYMNAGAYGGEMKDVIVSVTALDDDLCEVAYSCAGCDFSYRHSRFYDGGVILSAKIKLTHGDSGAIKAKMDELAGKRREKQPLNYPSAGSTFKRPESGYAAAMIDEAGLRGFSVGGAQVSEKHAGFVINRGGATFSDVLTVMEHVQKTVFDTTGVMLSPEIKIIR